MKMFLPFWHNNIFIISEWKNGDENNFNTSIIMFLGKAHHQTIKFTKNWLTVYTFY